MTELTVRLNEFDAALLEDLVKNTGESKVEKVTKVLLAPVVSLAKALVLSQRSSERSPHSKDSNKSL